VIFSHDRRALRKMYRDAWAKSKRGALLSPLEAQIAAVIEQHPEYHAAIGHEDLEAEFTPEAGATNPYLHLGMHLAIREQVATDRPPGIAGVFRDLADRRGDALAAEHLMMEALGETLWEAQRDNRTPDEVAYLERLRQLARARPGGDSM